MAKKSTSKSPKASVITPTNKKSYFKIYFYIPNLIGYLRVFLTIYGIYGLSTLNKNATLWAWSVPLVSYCVSFILDFFDGYAARHFKQTSDFGAVLDMVTDRVSTMLLLFILGGKLYPNKFLLYSGLAGLDYSSHWVQMYASKGHHKTTNQEKKFLS